MEVALNRIRRIGRSGTWVAAVLCLFLAPAEGTTANAVRWRAWNEGFQEAQRLKRPVVVDVYTQWCGWCKRMDREVYARADVRDYLNARFVPIQVDAEAKDPATHEGQALTSRSLAAHFRVTGYPTTIFLRSDGEHLVSVPGYLDAEKFLLVLRYIGDGHLDRGVKWEDYRAGRKP